MSAQMTGLVRYEAARHALQIAHRVDEVKNIRDKAQAMAAYARQAKDTELVEWATEIKVRAERRAGEMLAEMAAKNGRAGAGRSEAGRMGAAKLHGWSQAATSQTSLAQLGVSKDQSQRWQKLAAVPQRQFEEAVAAAKQVAGEVTTAALLRLNRKPERAPLVDEDDDVEPPENRVTAFLLRADQARAFASYSGRATNDVVSATRRVIAAWELLLSKLENQR